MRLRLFAGSSSKIQDRGQSPSFVVPLCDIPPRGHPVEARQIEGQDEVSRVVSWLVVRIVLRRLAALEDAALEASRLLP